MVFKTHRSGNQGRVAFPALVLHPSDFEIATHIVIQGVGIAFKVQEVRNQGGDSLCGPVSLPHRLGGGWGVELLYITACAAQLYSTGSMHSPEPGTASPALVPKLLALKPLPVLLTWVAGAAFKTLFMAPVTILFPTLLEQSTVFTIKI